MMKGRGVWYCPACKKTFRGDENDDTCPTCGFVGCAARPDMKMVRGSSYTPYGGKTLWADVANAVLRDKAEDNFYKERR